MRYILTILSFLSLFLVSCTEKPQIVSPSVDTNTTYKGDTDVIVPESRQEEIPQPNEKSRGLLTSEEVTNILKETNNNDFVEEIPRVNTYYSSSPFYEFYILSSIFEDSIEKCERIDSVKDRNICEKLYSSKDDKAQFIGEYIAYGESADFSSNMYDVVSGIQNRDCGDLDTILAYTMCKKILDKDLDVMPIFIDYSRIIMSPFFKKDDIKNAIDSFPYDDGFRNVVEKNIFF